jgi:Zinc-binding dehydrogenase
MNFASDHERASTSLGRTDESGCRGRPLLKALVEAGKFRPVIDRRYPLEEVVEASRYVETEQKTGNVVLTINGGGVR